MRTGRAQRLTSVFDASAIFLASLNLSGVRAPTPGEHV
jgi:hypothetical protein